MAAETRRVLVVGATGNQGGAVVDALLEMDKPYDIRGLTRDAESAAARELSERGVEMVEGDLEIKESLREAVAGVDTVFAVTNFWTSGYESQVLQGKNIADAAADAGVVHFILSGVGSHDQDTGIPHFESAWEIDQYIQQLELPNTVLKPVFFFQNLEAMSDDILDGTLAMPLAPDVSLQMIDVADIGRAAAHAVDNPDDFIGERIDLAGDEKTLEEMADAFSAVIETPVKPVHVPIEQAREQLGDEMTDMFDWFNRVGYSADIHALEHDIFGFTFARLEDYLIANDWGAE